MTPRKRRQRLDSIHQIAEQLRQSADVPAPDLTSSILAQVDAQRPFLDRRTRRMLWAGRAALGLSVALVALGVALTHRWAPEAVEVVSRPAPLSNVVETVRTEATERLGDLRNAVAETVVAAAPSGRSGGDQGSGLLALVAGAGSADSVHAGCLFCGPVLPPAEAARRAPAPSASTIALSPAETSRLGAHRVWLGAMQSPLPPAPPARARAALFSEGRRSGLEDLGPLGAGPLADSPLAPK